MDIPDWQLDADSYTETYLLQLPCGQIRMEQWHGDRGDWRTTLDVTQPVSQIAPFISNAYYFDLEAGQKEVHRWIEISQSLVDLKNSWNMRQHDSALLLPGKICIVSVVRFLFPFEVWMVAPCVPFGVESVLHVDVDDRFPRWFLDQEIACSESIAWLKRRNQLITERFVSCQEADRQGLYLAAMTPDA